VLVRELLISRLRITCRASTHP